MIFYGLKSDVCNFATAIQIKGIESKIFKIGKTNICEIEFEENVIAANMAQDFSLQPTNTWSENILGLKSQRRK